MRMTSEFFLVISAMLRTKTGLSKLRLKYFSYTPDKISEILP